jgi:hypothetical protein
MAPDNKIASAAMPQAGIDRHQTGGLMTFTVDPSEMAAWNASPRGRRNSHMSGLTCRNTGRKRRKLMQLLVLPLANRRRRQDVTAHQPHELLRIRFVAMITGILMRHRPTRDVVGPCAGWLCPALA